MWISIGMFRQLAGMQNIRHSLILYTNYTYDGVLLYVRMEYVYLITQGTGKYTTPDAGGAFVIT